MTEFRVVIDRGDGVQDEIATWLDKEWIPRDIHREIGEAAGSVVLEAREEGMHDASGILFKVSDLLLQSTGKDVAPLHFPCIPSSIFGTDIAVFAIRCAAPVLQTPRQTSPSEEDASCACARVYVMAGPAAPLLCTGPRVRGRTGGDVTR
eukprot:2186146-Rhodomonas_salina.1